ncbi:unnamed protein product [Linum trigynum]|uniref:Uncharacterized protein n=1 Tax=Linum trigynum TaxID=586398 RepID=A0AAV2E7Q1_9ROSI
MAAPPIQQETASWLLENGSYKVLTKEARQGHGHSHHGRTAHNMSSSSLRKKSDLTLVSKVQCGLLRSADAQRSFGFRV